MSDTPRTDSIPRRGAFHHYVVDDVLNLCRQLERELSTRPAPSLAAPWTESSMDASQFPPPTFTPPKPGIWEVTETGMRMIGPLASAPTGEEWMRAAVEEMAKATDAASVGQRWLTEEYITEQLAILQRHHQPSAEVADLMGQPATKIWCIEVETRYVAMRAEIAQLREERDKALNYVKLYEVSDHLVMGGEDRKAIREVIAERDQLREMVREQQGALTKLKDTQS